MTNQERQHSLDNKYVKGTAKRGKADWCMVCKHRMPNGGCRIKTEKATEGCVCAQAYNRSKRK